MSAGRTPVPAEALATLKRRLAALPPRHPDRKKMMKSTCRFYAVSRATLYRALRRDHRPRDAHRTDRGHARVMGDGEIERWCEIVAAVKKSTTNRKGRHLLTARALKLVEEHGVHTPEGHRQLARGLLTISTLNRHMRRLGYDHARMTREPAAVRFQAERANDLWHFDMSPSDLKQLAAPPPWVDLERGGAPTLMLFSVVDDRSGLAYLEYHCVYGEDVEAALGFLFRAMSPKSEGATNPLQGIPRRLYLDNGPVATSAVFKRVMESLDIDATPHMPAGSDGARTTARAKGKVERPFRTVKEAHETLYHHHQPDTEAEANAWLVRLVDRENTRDHRTQPHSRVDDWLENQPEGGVRAMCECERFCSFAREPERRTVGLDARVSVAGVAYELDPELAGETVVLWWGLFDAELFAEFGDERYGPFDPVGGPVPLHRYRKHRKTRRDVRQDRVAELATRITIPRSTLSGEPDLVAREPQRAVVATRPFAGPDRFEELAFATSLKARAAIADELRVPPGKLAADDLGFIADLLARTLVRAEVMAANRERFPPGPAHAG